MITKYKFTEETIEYDGHILHRIQALKKIGDVKKGDLGGWIEKEENLSQEGKCWIFDNAKVYGNAFVWSNVCIYDDAIVCDDTQVFGDVGIYKKAKIHGNALVCGDAEIYGHAEIYGNAIICDNAKIYDNACICGNTNVYGNAKIYGEARIYNKCMIRDSAKVYGNAKVFGNAEITGNAEVNSIKDYLVFKNNWSSGRYFTWTLSNNMWCVGCFYGTGEELIKKAYADSEESGRKYEKCVKFVEDLNK